MNSIYDLNNWSNQSVAYIDDRPYSIVFSANNPSNQTVSINEGDTHVVQTGTEIIDLLSITGNVTYTVNVSSVSGATVTWTSPLPTGITANVVSTGVYQLIGVNSVGLWDQIKNPIVTMPADFANNWSYTTTIAFPSYGNVTNKSWTTNVTVANLTEITTPTSITYNEDQVTSISSYPQITDVEHTSGTYSIIITPSTSSAVRLLSSAGTGGSSSFNTGTKTLTITGSKTQVNSHLATITLTPGVDYDQNFSLNYSLTNPSGLNSQVTQNWYIGITNSEVVNIAYDRYYTENGYGLLFSNNVPQISEITSETYSIALSLSSNIGLIGLGESFSSPIGWDSSTNTYVFSGTRVECNNIFNSLRFFPNKGITSNATVTYNQYRSSSLQVNQTFNLIGNATTNTNSVSSGNVSLTEDGSITSQYVTAYPHYSDQYCIIAESQIGGTNSSTSIYLTDANGWSYIGSNVAQQGIYKNYSSATSYTSYLSSIGNIAIPDLPLYPDTTTNFTLKKRLVIGGTFNGSSVSGGTTYTGNTIVTITSAGEYTAPITLDGTIKNSISLNGYSIDDGGSNRTYTITLTDTTNLGNFTFAGVNRGHTFSYTGSKSSINSYLSSGSWISTTTGSTTFEFSLIRTSPIAATLASNISTAVTYRIPNAGESWQGGYYVGTFDSTGGSTPNYYLVASAKLGPYVEWTTSLSSTVPSNNSEYNGYTNTQNLYDFGYTNILYNLQAIRLCWDYSISSAGVTYSDWYLPSTQELISAHNVASSLFDTGLWSSTVNSGRVYYVDGSTSSSYTYSSLQSGTTYKDVRAFRRIAI